MAQLLETRCVSETFFGSKHVVRVACIGDSMMYGAAVPSRQILPAQLAEFLNAAYPDNLVWVDKFGEGSGQIWNAWSQFKERARHSRFNALIFSVCQNDITLLDSNDLTYPDANYIKLWTEDEDLIYFSKLLFEDIKEYCDSNKIFPVVIFFTLIENDLPIIRHIEKICKDLELTFVDLLTFFKERTSINPLTYIATPFDGHPSAFGHELAARGLTDVLRRSCQFAEGEFETRPNQVMVSALTDLIVQGVDADSTLAWATQALAAKERAARRVRGPDGVQPGNALALITDSVRALAKRWRVLRRVDVRVNLADDPANALLPRLDMLYAMLRNLDELIYILSTSPKLDRLAFVGRRYLDGWYGEADRLKDFTGDVAGETVKARDVLDGLPVVGLLRREAEAASSSRALPGVSTMEQLIGGLSLPELGCLGRFARRLREQLDAIAVAWPTLRPVHAGDADVMRLWAIAFFLIHNALWHLRESDNIFSNGPELEAPIPAPWTTLDVSVEGDPDPSAEGDRFLLIVDANYRVPRRMPIFEAHWGGVAMPRYSYHFEIPALLLGNVRIGVRDNEPSRDYFLRGATRIAEVKIWSGIPGDPSMRPQLGLEWRNPGDNLPYVEFKDLILP